MESGYLHEYEIWEQITLDCLAKGACLTDKCKKESNCFVNAQAAHLAWQTAHKETVAHEIGLRLYLYEQAHPMIKKSKNNPGNK